ncbi:MAG: gel scht [Burkholderiaceae bacterium]|nr:gel scht [Burkholderiaceae bacterium]
MKHILIALLATLSVGAASAADSTVHIKPTPRYQLNQQDMDDYKQSFALSNGQTMKFSVRQSHVYVQLDKGARVEIFPVAKDRFQSDAGTQFEFRDENETIAVSNFGLLPMAGAPANSTVLARR